jgi:DNA-directed RNA polymerase subunit RPC12/RpoP
MKLVCQACQAEIDLPQPENPRIINLPAVSMIVLEHPHIYRCTECGVHVSIGLCGGAPLSLVAIPLPEDKKPAAVSQILAPSGLNIRKN